MFWDPLCWVGILIFFPCLHGFLPNSAAAWSFVQTAFLLFPRISCSWRCTPSSVAWSESLIFVTRDSWNKDASGTWTTASLKVTVFHFQVKAKKTRKFLLRGGSLLLLDVCYFICSQWIEERVKKILQLISDSFSDRWTAALEED